MQNYYKKGEWNAICDVCGFKFKSGMMKERWDGLMVCRDDYETRHPQDLLKVKQENVTPPWTRPQQSDQYISVTYLNQDDYMADGYVNGGYVGP